MVDCDLAVLYGVELKRMNEAVKRNIERFPADFMFQFTGDEWDSLRSQIVTAKRDITKIRYIPYVFTEHGVLIFLFPIPSLPYSPILTIIKESDA